MRQLIQPTIILLLYVCVRSADLSITAAFAKNTLCCIAYGIIALLALIALIIALIV